MEDYDKTHWANKGCPKYDCRKAACKCGLKFVDIPAILGDDSEGSDVAPKNGEYCNAIVRYEANGRVYIYSKEGVPVLAGSDIESLEKMIKKEILDRQGADNVLQQEIDDLKNSPDVVDIVATYADLQAYDTSKLGDNDIVRVLADETHDGDSTYYRWSTSTSSWTYIGGISIVASTIFYADRSETGDTRHIYKDADLTQPATAQDLIDADEIGQVVLRIDMSNPSITRYFDGHLQDISYMGNWVTCNFRFLFNYTYYEYAAASASDSSYSFYAYDIQEKLTAGTNISISGDTISATDTTYSDFTGTDGVDPGTAGLVPAPATTDAGKFLNADGGWESVVEADGYILSGAGAPTTSTAGTVGMLYEDTTNGKLYQCTAVSGSTYTWTEVGAGGGGVTPVQTIGTSTSDVMSQNATSGMVFADPAIGNKIKIGNGCSIDNSLTNAIVIGQNSQIQVSSEDSIMIGNGGLCYGENGVAIGKQANAASGGNYGTIAIGYGAVSRSPWEVSIGVGVDTYTSNLLSCVNLGSYSKATRQGEVNISTAGQAGQGYGYNGTDYRVIGGVHDGQNNHDAATVAQGNTLSTSAPTTSTVGVLGQLWTDTTNMHTYQCTAISGSTYTWQMRW